MNRRDFLKGSLLTAAAAGGWSRGGAAAVGKGGPAMGSGSGWVDVNVSLFHWPCRRLPLDQTEALVAKLREHGFAEAWAGSFEGILHRDLGGVNERLAAECRRVGGGLLVPFGSVNPTLPDWEEDLRRCHEQWRMPGIRLHPNYHGYTLQDPRFARLLALATERGLLVQIAVLLEDTRTQSRLLRVDDVDVTPLFDLLPRVPGVRVLLLNSGKTLARPPLERFAATSGLFHDIARVEASGHVGRVVGALPPGRVLFGSHAPFFIFESALIKLDESGLGADELRGVLADNARRLRAPI